MSVGQAQPPSPTVLRADRIFDGERFIDTPLVQIDGRSIVAVGADVDQHLPIVDLGGVTLMPGIVDCHQHLVFDGNGTYETQVADQTDEQLAARAWRHARTALVGGVTTVFLWKAFGPASTKTRTGCVSLILGSWSPVT